MNVFDSGGAAFNRVWRGTTIMHSGQSRQVHWLNSLAKGKIGYTSIPGGRRGGRRELSGDQDWPSPAIRFILKKL